MILQVRGLTKNFGGLRAVSEVDFSIEEGSIAAIIGPNGAGKTTFFNVVSGFYRPSSGRVFFQGQDVTGLSAHQIAQLGMARTFQNTSVFSEATVIENVMIGHRLRTKSNLWDALFRTPRLKREEAKCVENALEVLSFVGLDEVVPVVVDFRDGLFLRFTR